MPEMPEIQAHAERLSADFAGIPLQRFVPLTFTALKTAVPAPDAAYGLPLEEVGRRGKYLLLRFEPITFVVHLMQGGRLVVDTKQAAKPRGGQARFVFDGAAVPALLLTEQGTERRAGIWCVERGVEQTSPAARQARPGGGDDLERTSWPACSPRRTSASTASCATSAASPGSAGASPTRCCHRAKVSPFAMTGKLGADGAAAIVAGDPRRRRGRASSTSARATT